MNKLKGFHRRMWALVDPDNAGWGFDVYFTRSEARRVRSVGEQIIPVTVFTHKKDNKR